MSADLTERIAGIFGKPVHKIIPESEQVQALHNEEWEQIKPYLKFYPGFFKSWEQLEEEAIERERAKNRKPKKAQSEDMFNI